MRGESEEAFADLGERLFRSKIAGTIRRESRALVLAHQRAGHTVAVASAATKYQIAPVARDLGVEHLVCTRLVVEDGQFTGATDGPDAVGAPQGQRRTGLRARARGRPRPVLRLRQRLRGRRLPVLRRPPHRAQPAPRPARRGRAPRLARARPQRPGRRLAARRRTYGGRARRHERRCRPRPGLRARARRPARGPQRRDPPRHPPADGDRGRVDERAPPGAALDPPPRDLRRQPPELARHPGPRPAARARLHHRRQEGGALGPAGRGRVGRHRPRVDRPLRLGVRPRDARRGRRPDPLAARR